MLFISTYSVLHSHFGHHMEEISSCWYISSIWAEYLALTKCRFTLSVGVSSPPARLKSVGKSRYFLTWAALLTTLLLTRSRASLMAALTSMLSSSTTSCVDVAVLPNQETSTR